MENNGTIGVIVHPDRFRQLLDREQELLGFHAKYPQGLASMSPERDVEKDLNQGSHPVISKTEVEEAVKEVFPQYTYEGKDYALLINSKIKMKGVLDKLIAHPTIGAGIKTAFGTKEMYDHVGKAWLNVVVYKCLYPNPEGEIWVRMKEDFDAKFVAKP